MTAKILTYLFFTTETDGVFCEVRAMAKGLVKVGTTEFAKNCDISLFSYVDNNRLLLCGQDIQKVCRMCCEKRGKAHAKRIVSVPFKHDISLFRYIDNNRLLICG